MTLPELLVSITVLGTIVAVLSSAVIVTLRQQSNTEGRFNVARAEQNIGMWMPADLASAAKVTDGPADLPCPGDVGGAPCPGVDLNPGSSALLIQWDTLLDDDGGARTVRYTGVSYYFSQADDGSFILSRIECEKVASEGGQIGPGWSCSSSTVVRDLPGSPAGAWDPGITDPWWVIDVTLPLEADATDVTQVAADNAKNAQRVVVTVHGGGSSGGAGGGSNEISITAGGTFRNEIDAQSLQGAPSFVEALSRCGGPMTLVVDESISIGSNVNLIRNGVREFVETLAGTPVRLQIMPFNDRARVLGTSGWHRYFDMTDPDQVDELLAVIPQIQQAGGGGGGYTNWEDALFRSFRAQDGTTPQTLPKTWVFFTDGVPNRDRETLRSDGAPELLPAQYSAAWGARNSGAGYSQVAFYRAYHWARAAGSGVERLVGVAVGDAVGTGTASRSPWVSNPGAGYHNEVTSQSHESRQDFESQRNYQSRTNFQRRSGSSWVATTPAEYYANNTPAGDHSSSTDGWRINGTRTWYSVTPSEYHLNSSHLSSNWRINGTRSWYDVTPTEYHSYRGGNTGNWRIRSSSNRNPTWYPVTEAEYDSYASTSPSDWRQNDVTSKVYGGAPPFDGYDPLVSVDTDNTTIIGRLITGSENFVMVDLAQPGEVADASDLEVDLYKSSSWSHLGPALKAIALGECGGTLTLQTRLGGAAASNPFVYQNSAQFSAGGAPLDIVPTTVTTNRQATTGTFSFDVEDGLHREVVIVPHNLSSLGSYQPVSWSCRAGIQDRSFELVDVLDVDGSVSVWKGIRVAVGANEAVSCTQVVAQ